MRIGDDRASEVGRTALAAARAAGAREQEASALLTLGSSLSYLERPRGGRGAPARGTTAGPRRGRPRDSAARLRQPVRRARGPGPPRGGRHRGPGRDRTRDPGRSLAQLRRVPGGQPHGAARAPRRLAGGRAGRRRGDGQRPARGLRRDGPGTAGVPRGEDRAARRRAPARPRGQAAARREPRAAVHPVAALHRGGGGAGPRGPGHGRRPHRDRARREHGLVGALLVAAHLAGRARSPPTRPSVGGTSHEPPVVTVEPHVPSSHLDSYVGSSSPAARAYRALTDAE